MSGSGLRPGRQAPPGLAWSPTGSRTPPVIGPGSWPGGPATPRPTSAWPAATASTSWTSTAPPAPRPSRSWRPPMACRAPGRWSAPAGVAGTTTWPPPASATPAPPGWRMWIGGVGVAMWSPHPAATPPATPTSGPPAAISTPHPARCPRCCSSGSSPANRQRPTGPVQLPAVADGPGDRYARAALAEELARVAAAPVGQRNRQLWESTRNLYNLVAAGALDHRQVDQGLLAAAERCGLLAEEPRQTHRTLASGRQVGLAHPGRPPSPPAPNAPMPRRSRPCGRPASEPRRGR